MGSSSDKRTASGNTAGEWLVNVADDVVVPMTTLQVIDGLRAERLSDLSLVWRIGMHDWTRIVDVPQLRLVAGTRSQPPPSARVTQPPLAAQAESQRRRNTLPFGFPAMNELASGRPTSAASVPGKGEPIAVYDRPTPSLTFSDAARADWEGKVPSAQRFTPVPSMPAALSQKPQSTIPNSLAPTTAEAGDAADRARGPGAWGDLNELLASERRADQRNSRRAVLWAALGSAALAAVFTLWLLKSPVARTPEPPAQSVEASEAPALVPTLEGHATPSASVENETPVASASAPKRFAPRGVKRTKGALSSDAASNAPLEAEPAPAADAPSEPAAVPAAAVEPAAPIVTPAPIAPPAPDAQ